MKGVDRGKASKNGDPTVELFRHCSTDGERMRTLAELYCDAFTWRQEEDERMKALERRIHVLEARIDERRDTRVASDGAG